MNRNQKTKLLFVLAHGESWEVAASRAVSDLVTKVIQDQVAKGHYRPGGTFNLHYKPPNENEQSITIPLTNSNPNPQPANHVETNSGQNKEPDGYFKKVARF